MTDQEKLQKLFDAALKDGSDLNRKLTRVGPAQSPALSREPVSNAAVAVMEAPVAVQVPAEAEAPSGDFVKPMENAGLDQQTSEELAKLLDEKMARNARKDRRGRIFTLLFFLLLTGGGAGWVIKSPERVQAFCDALRDIRSVGDVKSMVAKFQKSLDKVAVRGEQIDQATKAMGAAEGKGDHEDIYFTAEMKQMMGKEGEGQKTVGERAQKLDSAFNHMREKNGVKEHNKEVKLKEDESFLWEEMAPAAAR